MVNEKNAKMTILLESFIKLKIQKHVAQLFRLIESKDFAAKF